MTLNLLHLVEKDGTGIQGQEGLPPGRRMVYQGRHHTGRVGGAWKLQMPRLPIECSCAGD